MTEVRVTTAAVEINNAFFVLLSYSSFSSM